LSDQTRELPEQPSLRFLKLEAKRRLAAGEFATLHDAQLAVAREHGLSSWTVLKETVTADQAAANPALAQVHWLISRFGGADGAAWERPAEQEMREHFADQFLAQAPPDVIIGTLARAAPMLRGDLVVTGYPADLAVRTQVGGMRLDAAVEADPPHRLTMAQLLRLSQHVTDERVTDPPVVTAGPVPDAALELARASLAELGLPGLILAGATAAGAGGGPAWSLALGRADLDRPEPLGAGRRFPSYAITMVVTATAALRLVASGVIELDAPANQYLRTVRLADGEVTVRELLSHTGGVGHGVDDPADLFGPAVTDLVTLTGPVMPCPGPRGAVSYSVGGYGVLGQLIADVTGARYQDAARSLVLDPLGMTGSFFPAAWPERDAARGYQLTDDGRFEPAPARVCVIAAAGGLWTTAADVARFGVTWDSLLPAGLAAEALRPQAPPGNPGPRFGLGWPLHPGERNLAGLVGGAPGTCASLLIVPGGGRASVAVATRLAPTAIEQLNASLLQPA